MTQPEQELADKEDHAGRTSEAVSGAMSPTECARTTLRCRAAHVGDREFQRAVAELDLDERERAAVATLVARLLAGVLARPDATLRAAGETDLTAEDDETLAAVVLALFDGVE